MVESIQDVMGHMPRDPKQEANYQTIYQAVVNHPEVKQFLKTFQIDKTDPIVERSLAKLHEFITEFNLAQHHQPPSEVTPELFLNVNFIDVRYVATASYFARQVARERDMLLDNHMMSRDVKSAMLVKYDLDTSDRQHAMDKVADFLEAYQQDPFRAKGLYLHGPFGVGKTYLLGALANHMVTQFHIPVTMLHYPTFINELKDGFKDQTTQTRINAVKTVDILMLDDIGAESNTAWTRDDVLNPILEHRMKESLPTFFTSNLPMDLLEDHLMNTRDSYDTIKAKRVMERIYYLAEPVALGGRDRREKAGQ